MKEPIWFWWLMLVLAIDAVMVVWFRGNLFATPRATAEAWAESDSWLKWWLGGFLSCPLCLPPYVAVELYLLITYVPHGDAALYAIAASGMASRLYNSIWPPKVPPGIESVRHE